MLLTPNRHICTDRRILILGFKRVKENWSILIHYKPNITDLNKSVREPLFFFNNNNNNLKKNNLPKASKSSNLNFQNSVKKIILKF